MSKKLIFRKHLMDKDLAERKQPPAGAWANSIDGCSPKEKAGELVWAGYIYKSVNTPIGMMRNKEPFACYLERDWCEEVNE